MASDLRRQFGASSYAETYLGEQLGENVRVLTSGDRPTKGVNYVVHRHPMSEIFAGAECDFVVFDSESRPVLYVEVSSDSHSRPRRSESLQKVWERDIVKLRYAADRGLPWMEFFFGERKKHAARLRDFAERLTVLAALPTAYQADFLQVYGSKWMIEPYRATTRLLAKKASQAAAGSSGTKEYEDYSGAVRLFGQRAHEASRILRRVARDGQIRLTREHAGEISSEIAEELGHVRPLTLHQLRRWEGDKEPWCK